MNGDVSIFIGFSRKLLNLLHAETEPWCGVCKTFGGRSLQTTSVRSPIRELSHGVAQPSYDGRGYTGKIQNKDFDA